MSGSQNSTSQKKLMPLLLGALGVVYGDIGTSPLYALKLMLSGEKGLTMTTDHILGGLSMIFWAITITVTIKYVVIILRADHHGQGGVMALATLASRGLRKNSKRRTFFTFLAIIGFSLFFGDSLITPAISVLSAVEGLSTATSVFDAMIVPLTLAILIGLFMAQSRGTHHMGRFFGPIMLVWFVVLAVMGVSHIVYAPEIVQALNPIYALGVILESPMKALVVMGFAVLAITGGEALYADMGHFGARPIRLCWFWMVAPALLLNYFGQGALLLRHPEKVENLFFEMAPDWALYPLVALATLATIIASQAVISGLFSMTQQAVSLGYLPRMHIQHTSAEEIGQIYVPRMNWLAMLGVITLVLIFRNSESLANAYGIAVTGVVLVDSFLVSYVAVKLWKWPILPTIVLFSVMILVDIMFFASTAIKFMDGGWFPLLITLIVYGLVQTWRHGRKFMYERLYLDAQGIEDFLQNLPQDVIRVSGTAVYLTTNVTRLPKALQYNYNYNKVLHKRIILMRVKISEVPWISAAERIEAKVLAQDVLAVTVNYGFMQQPDVPYALQLLCLDGWDIDPEQISYFLGRETLIASRLPGLGPLEERLFIILHALAENATAYFRIPPKRVLELGTRLEI
jgi:KUP system potassium uptake protein